VTTTALGADPDQLDALSRQLHRAAGDLRRSEREVDRLVKDTAWKGSRAAKFTQTWPGAAGRQLREAAAALDTMSDSAKRNADEQRQASGATSSQPFPSLAALTAAGLTIGVAGSTAKHMGLDRFLEGKGSSSVDGGLSISRGTTGEPGGPRDRHGWDRPRHRDRCHRRSSAKHTARMPMRALGRAVLILGRGRTQVP